MGVVVRTLFETAPIPLLSSRAVGSKSMTLMAEFSVISTRVAGSFPVRDGHPFGSAGKVKEAVSHQPSGGAIWSWGPGGSLLEKREK